VLGEFFPFSFFFFLKQGSFSSRPSPAGDLSGAVLALGAGKSITNGPI